MELCIFKVISPFWALFCDSPFWAQWLYVLCDKIFSYIKGKESFLYHFWLTRLTPKALVAYFQGGPRLSPSLLLVPMSWVGWPMVIMNLAGYCKAREPDAVSNQHHTGQDSPGSIQNAKEFCGKMDGSIWIKKRKWLQRQTYQIC